MKDPVKEFEDLNNRIENLFEAFNWGKLHPKNWLYKDKPQPNKQYVRSSSVEKHLANVDAKKSDLGKYNNRFTSEPGSSEAFFYDKSGKRSHVKDITPFIENAGITKATLRTYDLKKDPMKIGWLFDGNFEAELLDWNKSSKKVVFKGKWFPASSKFMGINYDQADNVPTAKKIEFKYFIKKADKEFGPFSSNDIVQSIKNKVTIKGFKNLNTIVRAENASDYEKISDNKTLSYFISSLNKVITTKNPAVAKPVRPIVKPTIAKRVPKKKP